MFRLVYRAICRLVFRVVCIVQLSVLWKLRDLALQIIVKIYYNYIIQIRYFTYLALSIVIKLLCLLAGRSAVDIWWWPFWGWGVFCMVNVVTTDHCTMTSISLLVKSDVSLAHAHCDKLRSLHLRYKCSSFRVQVVFGIRQAPACDLEPASANRRVQMIKPMLENARMHIIPRACLCCCFISIHAFYSFIFSIHRAHCNSLQATWNNW